MGTVIKADGVGRIKKRLATLALKDHMAEAQRVVREARVQSDRILEDTQVEIERRREQAKKRGYEDGFAEGRASGQSTGREEAYAASQAEFAEEQRPLVTSLTEMASAFASAKSDLLERAKHDMLVLAVAIAERVTKCTAELNRESAVANASEAMAAIAGATDIVIRVHPADMERMSKYAADLASSLSRKDHLSIVEDATVQPGGCLVDTAQTSIDATVEGQFREAAGLILGDSSVLAGRPGGEVGG